jgi:hypothetical protein
MTGLIEGGDLDPKPCIHWTTSDAGADGMVVRNFAYDFKAAPTPAVNLGQPWGMPAPVSCRSFQMITHQVYTWYEDP